MTTKKALIVIGFALALSVMLQLWMEERHYVDSLGLWYTIICALVYSVPIIMLSFCAIKKTNKMQNNAIETDRE